jgi:hypothetical protein
VTDTPDTGREWTPACTISPPHCSQDRSIVGCCAQARVVVGPVGIAQWSSDTGPRWSPGRLCCPSPASPAGVHGRATPVPTRGRCSPPPQQPGAGRHRTHRRRPGLRDSSRFLPRGSTSPACSAIVQQLVHGNAASILHRTPRPAGAARPARTRPSIRATPSANSARYRSTSTKASTLAAATAAEQHESHKFDLDGGCQVTERLTCP